MLRRSFLGLVALSGLSAIAAACGAPAAAPTPVPPSPTAAKPAATAAPSPAAPTATVAASPAATAPAASASPAASPAASADQIRYTLVPDGTEARFLVKEQLASRNLPSDAIGKTASVTGALVIQPDGKVISDQSKLTVDVQSLATDNAMRDGFIKRSTLQTSQFPSAEFVPTEVRGLPSPLPTSGSVQVQIVGDTTIHGVTRPTIWDVTATVADQDVKGTAKTAVKFGDFGMTQPKVASVLSVEDNIRLELDFHFKRGQS